MWAGERTPDVFLLNQCKYKIMKEVGRTREGAKVKPKNLAAVTAISSTILHDG